MYYSLLFKICTCTIYLKITKFDNMIQCGRCASTGGQIIQTIPLSLPKDEGLQPNNRICTPSRTYGLPSRLQSRIGRYSDHYYLRCSSYNSSRTSTIPKGELKATNKFLPFPLDKDKSKYLLSSQSKMAVACGISRPYFMEFARPYYVKRAISKLFHMKTWYGSDPGVIARVICSRVAGIFVANDVSKLSFISPFVDLLLPTPSTFPPNNNACVLCFSPG